MSRWLVEKSSSVLEERTSRRGFLVRTALAGSALTVAPWRYILRPGTAYAAICTCAGSGCDCGSACCDGYTEFCCVVNNGQNACPPGTYEGGWWRADGSQYCNGPRYYIDCNAQCGSPSPCSCATGDCNHRRAGCNQFRYGNCHTEISCFGPIACRVVTCTPPWQIYPACNQTLLFDNATANHNAVCPTPPAPLLPGYKLICLRSGKALDVGSSRADGAGVVQWTVNGGNSQRWMPQPLGDGTFGLYVRSSNKWLTVAGRSMVDGAPVVQQTWDGWLHQRWRVAASGPDSVNFIAVHSGKALDVQGRSVDDGAPVIQLTPNGRYSQKWRGELAT